VVIRLCNDLHSWTYALVDFATADFPVSAKYREALAGWSKITHHLWVWDYCVNFSHFLAPMPNWRVFDPSTRAYLENGVTGLMWQGNMSGLGTEAAPMRVWVLAKQLWDPSRDVSTLMADFIWAHYGAAAPAMAEYYNMVDRKWQEHMHDVGVDPLGMRYHPTTPFLSDGYVQEAQRILARAEALATGDEETRARVQLAKMPLLYTMLVHALGLQIHPWTLKPDDKYWVFKPDRRFVPQPPDREQLTRVLDEFEETARREHILFLAESPYDQPGTHLKAQIAAWRERLSALPDNSP
jgi:hypothetical protein